MQQDQLSLTDRIDSFLSRPDAGMLKGERRMGTGPLLDMLAERISLDESARVICVIERENALDHIGSQIKAGKKNHILLYVDVELAVTDQISEMFPDAQIYRVKELCHQVPVCFKESSSFLEKDLGCCVPR